MKDNVKIAALVIFAILAIGIGPLITIWWLNTLFMNGAIAYTLKTWFATALMHLTVGGIIGSSVKSK